MTEPNAPIPGWPQREDPRPPPRSRPARLVIAILWVVPFLWLVGGLPIITMLTIANEKGFVQLFWVWLIGLVAWVLVLRWTYRRTRPG
jgi:hypothetical protein